MLEIKDPTNEMFSELRTINDDQSAFIKALREKAKEILQLLEVLPNCRRKAVAVTRLEEAVLFATKAATYGN